MKAESNRNNPNNYLALATLLVGFSFSINYALAANAPAKHSASGKTSPVFATVGKDVITWGEYRNEIAYEAKTKFYHGRPADDELGVFQREVGNKMVDKLLQVQEAKRRKLKPDQTVVDEKLKEYEQRFVNDPNWPKVRKRVLAVVAKRLQDDNIRDQLETLVRNVPPPDTKQLQKYFDTHRDKFTPPPQNKVSIILIKVDPGATAQEWSKAMEEGQGLVKRLRAGEDFAEMARNYSGDITAEDGGDMGYLHAGMLPQLPEDTIGKLKPGETSDPIRLMEGVGIFRLADRVQPPPLSFEEAVSRIKPLWLSEQSDIAWNALNAKLRKSTPIHIDESRFKPLPVAKKSDNKDNDASPKKGK